MSGQGLAYFEQHDGALFDLSLECDFVKVVTFD